MFKTNLSKRYQISSIHFRILLFPILLLFTLAAILLCGNDGILRLNYPRWDSAWFFMAGKAWMEGMSPYVDFADSKGPLLWLIYGIGYLLSPDSFKGMFIIEVLAYWSTLCLIYKCALLEEKNELKALVVTFAMLIPYFFPIIHQEIRAEDFCNPLYALTLYSVLKISNGGKLPKYGFYMGLSVGGAFLIKYNIAAILSFPALLYVLSILFQDKKFTGKIISYISACLIGFLSVCLPFVIYFMVKGTIIDFINEYFINSFSTLELANSDDNSSLLNSSFYIKYIGGFNFRGLYILLSCVSACSLIFKMYKKIRFIVFSWFVVALFFSLIIPWDYYLFNLAIFWFFPLAAIVRKNYFTLNQARVIFLGVLILLCVWITNTYFFPNAEFYKYQKAYQYERNLNSLAQLSYQFQRNYKRLPTIAFLNSPDKGYTIKGKFLPGVKYWALQSTASEKMLEEHVSSIISGKPDFVIVDEKDSNEISNLRRNGYIEVLKFIGEGSSKNSETTQIVFKKVQPETSPSKN